MQKKVGNEKIEIYLPWASYQEEFFEFKYSCVLYDLLLTLYLDITTVLTL